MSAVCQVDGEGIFVPVLTAAAVWAVFEHQLITLPRGLRPLFNRKPLCIVRAECLR